MIRELRRRLQRTLIDATRFVPALGVRYTVARVPSFAQGIECLIASKRGLYVLQHGALDLILPGEFYGATRRGEDWYVFQKLATTGRLIRLRVDDSRVVVAARIGPTLSEGCHQIDMVDGALYVTDTYNNRLLVLRVGAGGASIQRKLTPFGDLRQGRQSENYVHLNSIWRNARGLYAVLHNETSKTGRNSEIAVLSTSGEVIERRATPASHAHNVLEFRGKALYCDSKHASLRWGDDVVFKCEHFTRGLAVTPDHVLVGGSEYGARETRSRLGGKLFVLSHDFRLLGAIPLPGSVHEVRGLGADLGLSAPLR